MEASTSGDLLREARNRHGLSPEDLAIRAGIASVVVADIEADQISPTVEMLSGLLRLLGEDLQLGWGKWDTGVDLTLNQGNLKLSTDCRVQKGLAYADLVRQNRGGGADGLGRSLKPGPVLGTLARHGVDFVLIGSVAGLVHGSAYPTYDLDVAYAGGVENQNRLVTALHEIGVQGQVPAAQDVLSFDTEFGTVDLVRRIPGVESFEQLWRDSSRELLTGVAVQVASLDHLIAMKRAANRVKDQLMVLEYVELADEIRRRQAEET